MIKPIGLTIPECHCFKTGLQTMNERIDDLSAKVCLAVILAGRGLNICPQAHDYFISAIVADLLMTLLPKMKSDRETMQEVAKEYEEIYDRVKPLIMQRPEYADGVMDSERNR